MVLPILIFFGQRTWLSSRAILLIALFWPLLAWSALPVVQVEMDGLTARFTTPQADHIYFVLTESDNLKDFIATDIAIANAAWEWESDPPPDAEDWFWVMRTYGIHDPVDSDGDRIDDMYEFFHPVLSAVNPLDAYMQPEFDEEIGIQFTSYLQQYIVLFFSTGEGQSAQFYSKEISAFNFGAPMQSAISREYSVFNFGSGNEIEAISRIYSVYNGAAISTSGIEQVYSRETSIYNFGDPLFSVEAHSRILSIYNGQELPSDTGISQVYSRETSVFNFGAPKAAYEAYSREVSVNVLREGQ